MKTPPRSQANGKYATKHPESLAIFPIGLRIPDPENSNLTGYGVLGTGFCISKWGLFLTASHVFDEVDLKLQGQGLEAWFLIGDNIVPCGIDEVVKHASSDVAVGRILVPHTPDGKRISGFKISTCRLANSLQPTGQKIVTYGYPRTQLSYDREDKSTVNIDLYPDYYDGEITGHHAKGFSIAKWPIYAHTIPIASGMSGGPVFNTQTNEVIGINCTGYSTPDEDVAHGTCTDVREALSLKLISPHEQLLGRTVEEVLKHEGVL